MENNAPGIVYTVGAVSEKEVRVVEDRQSSFFYANRHKYNIVFLGSSIAANGIREDVVNRTLRKRGIKGSAFNLSRAGADIMQNTTLLDYIASPESAGQWVVIEPSRQSQFHTARRTLPKYRIKDFPSRIRGVMASGVPWRVKTGQFRTFTKDALQSYPVGTFWWIVRCKKMERENYQGWLVPADIVAEEVEPEIENPPTAPGWEIELLRDQIEIAKKHGIHLVYLIPPRGYITLDPRVHLQEEFKRGDFHIIDLNQADKNPELARYYYFQDVLHANRIGARRVSAVIAGKLAELMIKENRVNEGEGAEAPVVARKSNLLFKERT